MLCQVVNSWETMLCPLAEYTSTTKTTTTTTTTATTTTTTTSASELSNGVIVHIKNQISHETPEKNRLLFIYNSRFAGAQCGLWNK